MRFIRFTGGVIARLFALFVIVSILGMLAPQSAPQVGVTEAATGWYNRQVTWWFDDSTNGDNGGDVFRVKMIIAWQTTDPHSLCYSWANAAPDGTRFPAFNDGVSQCPWWRYGNNFGSDFYPSRNQTVACWVSNAFLVTVVIDHCGRIPDNQDYPPYWTTYGSLFRACTGIINTPFSFCSHEYRSKLTILGSTVRLWNSIDG